MAHATPRPSWIVAVYILCITILAAVQICDAPCSDHAGLQNIEYSYLARGAPRRTPPTRSLSRLVQVAWSSISTISHLLTMSTVPDGNSCNHPRLACSHPQVSREPRDARPESSPTSLLLSSAGYVMLFKQMLSSGPTGLQCLAGEGFEHIVPCQVQSLTRRYWNKRPVLRVPFASRKPCDARPRLNLTFLLLSSAGYVMLFKQILSSGPTGLQCLAEEGLGHIVPCQALPLV